MKTFMHTKFGRCIIEDINLEKNHVTAVVEKTAELKTFCLSLIPTSPLFYEVDNDLLVIANDYIKSRESIKQRELDLLLHKVKKMQRYNLDENRKIVLRQNWKHMYDVADTDREYHESRAIILNDELIFINASAALVYLEQNPKMGHLVYRACEDHKKYKKSDFRYATKDEIKKLCLYK